MASRCPRVTSRCSHVTSRCPCASGRCSCVTGFFTLGVGSVEIAVILLLWGEAPINLILCQNGTTSAYLKFLVGRLLILWNQMLSVNFRTKTRRVTYLVCLVGSLWGKKFLHLAYIIACLSFMTGALRLDLHVGATSLIACSVTSITTHLL